MVQTRAEYLVPIPLDSEGTRVTTWTTATDNEGVANSAMVAEALRNVLPPAYYAREAPYEPIYELARDIIPGEIRLADRYAKLAEQNPAEFRRVCGDGFVSAKVFGGSIDAVYTFRTRSREERQEVEGNVSGSFTVLETTGSAKATINKYNKEDRLKIVYRKLGSAGDALPVTESGLTKAIRTLPSSVRTNESPFKVVIAYYYELPNYPVGTSGSTATIDDIASQYYRLTSLRLRIDQIIKEETAYILTFDTT